MKGLIAILLILTALPARADEAAALRAQAYDFAYNLDHDRALAVFQRALALDRRAAATHRGIASINWLNIAFRRGTVTADEFLGGAPRRTIELPPPPPEQARMFAEHVARALSLSEERVRRNPADASAHYDLGATVGLQASYMASVEGRLFAAFRAARRAFDAHERVLDLAPHRRDAGLIVGTYRYLVSTLSLPGRWFAYVAGFGGGRERGVRLIEDAAAYPGEAQAEAKFALVLIYNREKQYDAALKVLADLRRRYPRNRLLWLETGATALRASRFGEGEKFLEEGLARLARDERPRIFGEEAQWKYKLGEARLALGKRPAARAALTAALEGPSREWVRARAHLALGRIAQTEGAGERALRHFTQAARLGESSRDRHTRDEAHRLIRMVR